MIDTRQRRCLLVVEASDLCLRVEGCHHILGPRDWGGRPGAGHAGRSAALQLPHRGGESEHKRVPLLQQPEVLLGPLLTPVIIEL